MWATVKLSSVHYIYVNELQKKEVKDFARSWDQEIKYCEKYIFKLQILISSIHQLRNKTFVTVPVFPTSQTQTSNNCITHLVNVPFYQCLVSYTQVKNE